MRTAFPDQQAAGRRTGRQADTPTTRQPDSSADESDESRGRRRAERREDVREMRGWGESGDDSSTARTAAEAAAMTWPDIAETERGVCGRSEQRVCVCVCVHSCACVCRRHPCVCAFARLLC